MRIMYLSTGCTQQGEDMTTVPLGHKQKQSVVAFLNYRELWVILDLQGFGRIPASLFPACKFIE